MTLDQYLSSISSAYKLGIATELYDTRIPNLTQETINKIANKIGLHFILAKDPEGNICMANNKEVRPEFLQTFAPIDILNYAYAVLHSSNFRTVDKKSLKTNFPYPKNTEIFWNLVEIGSQIKQIHSLQDINPENSIFKFNIEADCTVRNPCYVNTPPEEGNYGKIYINETQYFENIPETVWNFKIENHQPFHKWLNDREGQKLTFEDINYFQKLLIASSETDRLMKKIKIE